MVFRKGDGPRRRLCMVCGHSWSSRGNGNPKRCPSCRSSLWNVGERRAECAGCGHVWIPRTKGDPRKCPRCQSPKWKGNADDGTEIRKKSDADRLHDAVVMYSGGKSCLEAVTATGVPLETFIKEIRRKTDKYRL